MKLNWFTFCVFISFPQFSYSVEPTQATSVLHFHSEDARLQKYQNAWCWRIRVRLETVSMSSPTCRPPNTGCSFLLKYGGSFQALIDYNITRINFWDNVKTFTTQTRKTFRLDWSFGISLCRLRALWRSDLRTYWLNEWPSVYRDAFWWLLLLPLLLSLIRYSLAEQFLNPAHPCSSPAECLITVLYIGLFATNLV